MQYQPNPIDNSSIELAPELNQLIETLARNNHDLWAKARIAEGWRYGPKRDQSRLETPVLVPYDELPESEKRVDRQNAVETLKSIIHFGGKVEGPRAQPPTGDIVSAPEPWVPNRNPPWTREEYRALGKQANDKGQSLTAFDIANEALGLWPSDSPLVQIKALALARMGSTEPARELLASLPAPAADDEETLGILARTFKDVWLRTGDARDLRSARDNYLSAYGNNAEHYWTGINAATLSWVSGEPEIAVKLATEISRTCLDQLSHALENRKYWLMATVAEAALVVAASPNPDGIGNDWKEAERLFINARELAADNFGHLFTTWRNARIILRHLPSSVTERIARAFRVPRVAVFAGHRVDSPSRATPRFSPGIADEVKSAIRECLVRLNVGVGFSMAASGSDILFLEALQELGGRTHIVMPCNPEQFVEESVADSGDDWVFRFKAVVSRAEETIVTSDQRLILGGLMFRYAGDVLDGAAVMRAAQHETELLHMAVWNGLPGDGPGGTHDTVMRWKTRGHTIQVISPQKAAPGRHNTMHEVSASEIPLVHPPESAPIGNAAGVIAEVRAMIFADVKHFSRLSESQIPDFLRDFVGAVTAVARQSVPAPLFRNTWGDGFFFVFATAGDAARFSLRLRDRVAAIDRKAVGLPNDMSLRIALHAGPVFRFQDQLIERPNYVGSHVNYAARIEPVTPEGRIYATELFAALATLDSPGQFRFDYVGRVPLHKDFGRFPLYELNRD